eukprot:CAMPEP_0195537324 /NCGR_PEP_ID=MMETSP0794_2-20130614/47725_1 /TAXON_ID=515487 /ORGANISM="Stephanopyxis turris, Strain CCMP 815" /LENGTH=246 /DNA_ID=CAMNT_0040671011 /DNA_START=321 /DNA_END=1058 /DNA_ORIENTATION=+
MKIAQDNAQNVPRLAKLARNDGFPLILFWGDYGGCNTGFPLFTYAATASDKLCNTSWPVPGYNLLFFFQRKRPENWDTQHFKWNSSPKYGWANKIPKAVWRGRLTGPGPEVKWQDFPRSKLVEQSLIHSDIIDAGITGVPKSDVRIDDKEELKNAGFMNGTMFMRNFMRYRAVIDIDGNSWSSRFGQLLCYNSVVIKVEPDMVDWFWNELQPWTHYLPVYSNLTNLVNITSYAVADENQDEVSKII